MTPQNFFDKKMTVKDKILAFLEEKGVKKSDFFDTFGLAPSNFRGQSKQTGLSSDTIVKILTEYQDLSAEWLLRGEGDMIRGVHEQEPLIDTSTLNNPPTFLIDKIAEQAEEIGRLKAQIDELKRRRGDNAGGARSSAIADVG